MHFGSENGKIKASTTGWEEKQASNKERRRYFHS
jgi:hypothetical protein